MLCGLNELIGIKCLEEWLDYCRFLVSGSLYLLLLEIFYGFRDVRRGFRVWFDGFYFNFFIVFKEKYVILGMVAKNVWVVYVWF